MFSLNIKICLLVSLMVLEAYSYDPNYEDSDEDCCLDRPIIVKGEPKTDLYYIDKNRCIKLIDGYVITNCNRYKKFEACEYCRESLIHYNG